MEALTFVFAPCVPSIQPQCTSMVTLTTVSLRFACFLFPLVAIHVLNFPICCRSLPCTPSLLFHQRAAALPPSFHSIDPPALFSMLPCFLCLLKTLESLPYVIPCFSNFLLCVWASGYDVALDYVLSFLLFFFVNFFTVMPRWFYTFPAFVSPT